MTGITDGNSDIEGRFSYLSRDNVIREKVERKNPITSLEYFLLQSNEEENT